VSLGDNRTFAQENVEPVSRMLKYLEANYDPSVPTSPETTLTIVAGRQGSRLSHAHSTQFAYVRQSLLLWRTILRDFYCAFSS
jgi:hypothetical protein